MEEIYGNHGYKSNNYGHKWDVLIFGNIMTYLTRFNGN